MSMTIGLKNIHYAILTEDSDLGAVYEAPVKIPGAVNVTIAPQSSTENFFADDSVYETATVLSSINVEVQLADFPDEVQQKLFGHTLENGVLKKGDDTPPYIALGFESKKSNGKSKFVWLYKGRFAIPENAFATSEDAPSFNAQTASATFVKRQYDGLWMVSGDEDNASFSSGSTWFNQVFSTSSDATPPTVTVSPVDGATAVAVSSNVVWTFSEAIQSNTVNSANFIVMDSSTGAEVDGALSLSADKKVVTFDPTTNFSALTGYTAIANKNVKDMAGNVLASNSVVNFTTA
jgi:phi13 family phage major tail protein